MNTVSFQELINSRLMYDEALVRLRIKPKRNRWIVAYELAKELEENRIAGTIEKIDGERLGRMRYALTDLDGMRSILMQFKNDTSPLFREKFKKILDGSESSVDELSTNNEPRNTQLELMICARLKEVGLDAELGHINPDILVRANGRTYGIECKRIFIGSERSIRDNTKKAIEQLNNHFLDDRDFTKRGVVLLGIDRIYTKGEKILISSDENSVLSGLGEEVERFIKANRHNWHGVEKITNEQICGVFVHMSVTTLLTSPDMQVVANQFGVNNTYWTMWGEQMFSELVTDIAQFLGVVSIGGSK